MKRLTIIGLLVLFFNTSYANDCNISISGSDMMQFDKNTLEISSSCSEVMLTLKHSGNLTKDMMGHNVVIVATENFEAVIGTFNREAGIENGYLPDSPEVLVKTAMVGGGETTQITFDLSKFKEDGDYTFFCSFPGHYAIMKGKFVI